jgi:FkbM family methyltransferase
MGKLRAGARKVVGRVRAVHTRQKVRRIHRQVERRRAGRKLLQGFARAYPEAFFVEIGSNDGVRDDHLSTHIRSSRWRGLMVEPVPHVFERLRENYGDLDRVALVNAAIAPTGGTLPFYHLAEADPREREDLPDWYDSVGSFSREKVLEQKRSIPDVEERIRCLEVPAMPFDALCAEQGVDRVDLILTDTEGFDAEILGSIDFDAWRPRLVVYEHFHLDAEVREATAERLRGFGYRTMEEGFDTFCLREANGDELDQLWNCLEAVAPGASVEDERAA